MSTSVGVEEKDIRHRYVRLRVGNAVRVPSTEEGTRVELIDETFGLVHRASAHLPHYNGSLHFEHGVPKFAAACRSTNISIE